MLAVFTKVEALPSMADRVWILEHGIKKNNEELDNVCNVDVRPYICAFADDAGLPTVDARFDERRDLDGVRVGEASIDERPGGKAVDGGGEDDVCADIA